MNEKEKSHYSNPEQWIADAKKAGIGPGEITWIARLATAKGQLALRDRQLQYTERELYDLFLRCQAEGVKKPDDETVAMTASMATSGRNELAAATEMVVLAELILAALQYKARAAPLAIAGLEPAARVLTAVPEEKKARFQPK